MTELTGFEALDHIHSGGDLYFPPGYGMEKIVYDSETFSYYFVNSEDQLIRTGWNEARIANLLWKTEKGN